MSTARQIVALFTMILAAQLAGCAASGPSASTFSLRHLPDTTVGGAFNASESALVSQGYSLDRRDPASGILVTQPVESESRERYGNQARRLGTEGRRRRIVTMHTSEVQGGVNVFCRVMIQEQSTQVYQFLAETNRTSGSEETTAIDRDGATTARQNTVWRNVDRDRPAERAILEAIGTSSAPEPTEPGAPPEASAAE